MILTDERIESSLMTKLLSENLEAETISGAQYGEIMLTDESIESNIMTILLSENLEAENVVGL